MSTAHVERPAPEVPERIAAVLVPLDGSDFSERALPVAVRIAHRLGADVALFSAVPKEDDVEEREAALVALANSLAGFKVHRRVVVDLDPAGAIHEALRRLSPAVACLASHGRGRSAALVGSVATEVVARGHDPVVVVGPEVAPPFSGHGVVACVDDTPAAGPLAQVALGWSRLVREPAALLTVAEPAPEPVRGTKYLRAFGPEHPEEFLDSLAEPLRDEGEQVETRVVYDPVSPTDGVDLFQRERPTFLTVASSRARTGLSRAVFGSVAAAIVRRTDSPVMILPRRGVEV